MRLSKRNKLLLYPAVSAVLFIFALLSVIWIGGHLDTNFRIRADARVRLAEETSAVQSIAWRDTIRRESRLIERNFMILITVVATSAVSIGFLMYNAIGIYNDPKYTEQRKREKREAYSKKLKDLHGDDSSYSSSPRPAPKPPGPSGRPVIRSSASAPVAAPKPAPPPPVAAPRPAAPAPVAKAITALPPPPAPKPPSPPPPVPVPNPVPDEFPHEFPDILPEEPDEYEEFY